MTNISWLNNFRKCYSSSFIIWNIIATGSSLCILDLCLFDLYLSGYFIEMTTPVLLRANNILRHLIELEFTDSLERIKYINAIICHSNLKVSINCYVLRFFPNHSYILNIQNPTKYFCERLAILAVYHRKGKLKKTRNTNIYTCLFTTQKMKWWKRACSMRLAFSALCSFWQIGFSVWCWNEEMNKGFQVITKIYFNRKMFIN